MKGNLHDYEMPYVINIAQKIEMGVLRFMIFSVKHSE